jgi:hypothetical protein
MIIKFSYQLLWVNSHTSQADRDEWMGGTEAIAKFVEILSQPWPGLAGKMIPIAS